jgi:hypothetical protein
LDEELEADVEAKKPASVRKWPFTGSVDKFDSVDQRVQLSNLKKRITAPSQQHTLLPNSFTNEFNHEASSEINQRALAQIREAEELLAQLPPITYNSDGSLKEVEYKPPVPRRYNMNWAFSNSISSWGH